MLFHLCSSLLHFVFLRSQAGEAVSGDVELRRVIGGQKQVQVVSFLPIPIPFLFVLRELRGEAENDFLFWVKQSTKNPV